MNLGSAVWRSRDRFVAQIFAPAPAEPAHDELNRFFERSRRPGTAGLVLVGGGSSRMQDAVMLLFTVIFFVLAFLYVKACQKLR
jgi:hypothetical protein